ncbi:MAG TPA: hypothetical protein VIJ25_20350 [Methylococcales bacterium]
MTESCPLSKGERKGSVPFVCRQQCGELIIAATMKPGFVDSSCPEPTDDCDHLGDIQFNHDALEAVGDDGQRAYTIVDECAPCGTELGESTYLFICPNS